MRKAVNMSVLDIPRPVSEVSVLEVLRWSEAGAGAEISVMEVSRWSEALAGAENLRQEIETLSRGNVRPIARMDYSRYTLLLAPVFPTVVDLADLLVVLALGFEVVVGE